MIVNKANLNALFIGYKAQFQQGMQSRGTPVWKKIATEATSTTAEEMYPWLGKNTAFREWVGDRVLQSLMAHEYRIKNKPFENTVVVDRDSIEDDQYGMFNIPMQQLGEDAADHPDQLVFDLLAAGFTTQCYDGQNFFDTDHPVRVPGAGEVSVSNFQGGTGTPWFLLDTSRVLKPLILQTRKKYQFISKDQETDDNVFMQKQFIYGADGRSNVGFGLWQTAFASRETLDEASFDDAFAQMLNVKGDNGRSMKIEPKLLVVPPTLRAAAKSLIEAQQKANGASNTNFQAVEVLVTSLLS
jgi:phage major head subunit gpT-like protein